MYAIFYDGDVYRGYKEISYAGEEYSFQLKYDLVAALPTLDMSGENFYIKRNGPGDYVRVNLPAPPPTPEQELADLKQRTEDLEIMISILMGG